MKDRMFEAAQAVKKIYPDAWYAQRCELLKILEVIFEEFPNCYKQQWLGEKINLITFRFENEIYFWWDYVDGKVIQCSGLERMVGQLMGGKIRTEVLWNSDKTDCEPMIPKFPIHFSE